MRCWKWSPIDLILPRGDGARGLDIFNTVFKEDRGIEINVSNEAAVITR